ncbi:MAG: FecR domain-containing protein, partial [Myxococcales bacterium]|nr:FecR domain-containing protein [Myxococcales bacterium]
MMASEQRLRDFGRRMAEAQDAAMADGFDRDAAAARWEALLLEAPPEPRRSLVPVAAVLAVAAGLLGLVWLSMRPAPPLSVVVDAVPRAADAPLIAGASSPLSVGFSDGSALTLDAEGRASIAAVDARGAVLELERGRLHAAIVHRTDSRWRVRCGPFEVQVTGTRFDLAWDPGRGELAVSLFEGGVLVWGPALGGPQPVRAGERLTVSTERGEVRWGSATPEASVADAGEPALAPAGDGASIADAGEPANDPRDPARVEGASLMGAGEPATAPAAPAAAESASRTAPVVRAPQA